MKISELLKIEGMSCDHCVRAVKQALENTPGVEVRTVTIGSAEISDDPTAVSPEAIRASIEEEGYTVVGSG
jgi:copper chaperone